ncbi:MAG: serine/threonine protein kinase, partial [Burkholderiales bacterium]|nr:serine/threonine protein kinase [Burkholderiales bacterium]
EPLPPSRFNTQIPGEMDAVVRKALAKKADERFQSAEEFTRALAKAAAGASVAAGHSGDTTMVPPPSMKTGTAKAAAKLAPAPVTGPASPPAAPAQRKSQTLPLAIVGAVVLAAVAAGSWYLLQGRDKPADPVIAKATTAPPAGTGTATPVAPPPATTTATKTATATATPPVKTSPGALVISAVGLADPSEARYQADKSLMQADLRADSRSQLVEKAISLLVDRGSFTKNYELLRDKLLSRSGDFVTTVVREGAPETGKDGLVTLTTEAVVNVKAVQKSLNEMSRNERVQFIRASGDPKIAVRITTRDADSPNAPPQPSAAAENILKERIKSFGFRTWSEGAVGDTAGPDFIVEGTATIKRLSMKLEASGLTVTKYGLNGWTIKAIDRATGEEIYYNTKLPTGMGSWASEEQALTAIGTLIANEFTRDFFLSHQNVTGRRVVLKFENLPRGVGDEMLRRELTAMPPVLTVGPAKGGVFELSIAGNGPAGDVVAAGILKPLNAKLGQACFGLGAIAGDEVGVTFDAKCNDPAILGRLETNPPAALYNAPAQRQKAIVKNPDTLKKLMI